MNSNILINLKRKLYTGIILAALFFTFITPSVPASADDSLPFVFLSQYSATMKIGDVLQLYAVTSSNKLPSFKSSSSSVASVNTYGTVIAKKAGNAIITAKISGAQTSCKITVVPTKITLSNSSVSLQCDEQFALSAKTSTGAPVTYKSSKSSIATVSSSGLITAIKPGTCEISAKCQGSVATCKVTVKIPTITLSTNNINLYRLGAQKISAKTSSNRSVTFKTNKKSVATVTNNGIVKAIKHGTAIITASLDGASAKCTVNVKQPIIKLSDYDLTLKSGQSTTLIANVSSKNAPTFSSSNTSVVTVSAVGTVKAISKGKAKIYCKEDGVKATCNVTVTE